MKVLIDTCVIIDAIQQREPFSDAAEKILLLAASDEIEGYISAKSAIDVRYIIRKAIHNEMETRFYLSSLYDFLTIIDTTCADCTNALFTNNNDYEDAVLAEGAKRANVDFLITRNVNDFKGLGVDAICPKDFITSVLKNLEL